MKLNNKLRDLRNSSVLVTGAGGFIGVHLVKKISASGAKVHLLLRQPPMPMQLKAWKKEWETNSFLSFHYGDITERKTVSKIIHRVRPQRIFHLAGISSGSGQDAFNEHLKTNVGGTLNLLEAVVKENLHSFVFASTTELYGKNPVPFHEEQKIQPVSPYAISKACGEYLCQFFFKHFGVPTVILRISPAYGPYLNENRFLMKVFLSAMNQTDKEVKLTSPTDRRDFIYIEDVIDGILLSSLSPKATGQIINLGYRQTYSLQKIAQIISALTKTKPRVRWGAVPNSPFLQTCQKSDIRKANKILGWTPSTPLHDGLKKMYHWLLTQKQ